MEQAMDCWDLLDIPASLTCLKVIWVHMCVYPIIQMPNSKQHYTYFANLNLHFKPDTGTFESTMGNCCSLE